LPITISVVEGKSVAGDGAGWHTIARTTFSTRSSDRAFSPEGYMSFVIVLFPEPRDVFIDDQPQGSNRAASGRPRALFVNAGSHIFRLSGHGVEPATRTVDVPERPILDPFCVEFRKC
jgi:hypothetical protein